MLCVLCFSARIFLAVGPLLKAFEHRVEVFLRWGLFSLRSGAVRCHVRRLFAPFTDLEKILSIK